MISQIINNNIRELIKDYPMNYQNVLEQILTDKAKMIRPTLVLLGAGIISKDEFLEGEPSIQSNNFLRNQQDKNINTKFFEQDLLQTMTAIELTHISSLYHDDIIDNDDFRRGVKSVNNEFGVEKALIGGDIIFSMALKCLKGLGTKSYDILINAFDKMCRGQMMELSSTIDSKEKYFELISLKTGALIEAAVDLGIERNITDQGYMTNGELRIFSKNYGKWFQLNDDFDDQDPALKTCVITEKDLENAKNEL